MSTHGSLTECSVRPHDGNRKGREGKGREGNSLSQLGMASHLSNARVRRDAMPIEVAR